MNQSQMSRTPYRSRLRSVFVLLALAMVGAVLLVRPTVVRGASCTTTLNSGANVNAAITNAAGGDVICLNDGTYSINTNAVKSSNVTVQSTSGVGALVTQLTVSGAQRITFDHLTIHSLDLNNNATNFITVSNSVQQANNQTAYWEVSCRDWSGSKTIVFDGNTHSNTYHALVGNQFDGRFSLVGGGGLSGDRANCGGVQVKNSIFSGVNNTYCSDGIFLQAGNVRIGPGNHFSGMSQGNCGAAHVDSIQCYDCEGGVVITGNYFDTSSVAIGWYDGYDGAGALGFEISNNVFEGAGHQFVTIGGFSNLLFEHNTLNGTEVGMGSKTGDPQNRNFIVRNNLLTGNSSFSVANQQGDDCGSGCVVQNNFIATGSSVSGSYPACTNCINGGTPTFVGTTRNFASWANWRLTSASLGHNAGTDGKDIGISSYGSAISVPPPNAPTNVKIITP